MLELQRFLNDQGYFPRLKETPDGYTGYFGDLTKEALKAWQDDCHLAADGQFGQLCRQAVARCQVCQVAQPIYYISICTDTCYYSICVVTSGMPAGTACLFQYYCLLGDCCQSEC